VPDSDEIDMPETDYIRIWRFHDAPADLRALSNNGGDEDWLAVIPPSIFHADEDDWIGWMEAGHSFGCCDVSRYEHPTLAGYQVRIGSHA